jgi:polyisoprenoid-binding protein YceI
VTSGLLRPQRSACPWLLAACLALPTATVRAAPASFVLDPDHSFVHFEILHFATSTIRGRFGPIAGEVELDRAAGRGRLSLQIATASVETGLPVFDARLRQADLLASDEFPAAYFVATRLRFEGDRLAEVRGEFTWRGLSQPLSLHGLRFSCRVEAAQEVCGGDFEGEILRSEFGSTFGMPFVADRVRLLVQVEGQRRPGPAGG